MASKRSRYAVLTPFTQANVVAGVCAIARFEVEILPSETGALVLHEMSSLPYDEWDIRNITGPDQEEIDRLAREGDAESGSAVAAYLSRLSRYGVVLFDVVLAKNSGFENGISGEVHARRYLNGKAGEELSAGLLLQTLDMRLEKFLLGELDLRDLETIKAADMTTSDIARLAAGRKHQGISEETVEEEVGKRDESRSALDESFFDDDDDDDEGLL
ncbi:MAG: hypothetical protein IKS49_07690 [Actinomycetaceae bacterium]|nr:hypothetical protein [Actinomycetaceae bacterium]